jgi:tRNA threonylcarbamoyladenosine biosynthesis protein TsaB
MILGIDTSSSLTSVALLDGDRLVASAEHDDARQHGEVLASLVARVLDQADDPRPQQIACGVGPGPYTGLRVGIATAIALGLAWDIPVLGACSLDALAGGYAAAATGNFVVASDARRREVYWAAYDRHGIRIWGPHVGRVEAVDEEVRSWPWMGEGAAQAAEAVAFTGDASRPTAQDVARLVHSLLQAGEVIGPAVAGMSAHGTDDGSTAAELVGHRLLPPVPLYVRRPDAMGG